ncbi:MAG: hypothetical protein ATN33_08020 [Epulopiscium sp. Nele67-Bin001]|nr:MAG: hypothetical protein ATN33_08020 [Epulopiscium sp. Nele67-Bin001]
MKIFHSSDWHIGKKVNGVSMIEDQKVSLEGLMKLIETEEPDVLIIAGDLYDRAIPPVEAVALLNKTLTTLITKYNIKVITISGNHDSGDRINFASNILRYKGLYIMGDESRLFDKVEIGNVHFYLVPYKHPNSIKALIDTQINIQSHEDAMRYTIDLIRQQMDITVVNVMIAHGYVSKLSDKTDYESAGIQVSTSEKPLAIGGTDIMDYRIFDGFDYVALGHLHGRQSVGREGVRYSGSLCKYSFSETRQIKSITEIDITQTLNIKYHNLPVNRDFRVIEGEINDLIAQGRKEMSQDYIHAIITNEGELLNPIARLREVYPNILSLVKKSKLEAELGDITAVNKSKNPFELFEDFYKTCSDSNYNTQKQDYVKSIIEEALEENL